MEMIKGKVKFWKPFLLWLAGFTVVYLFVGIGVRTLIDFGVVAVGAEADPFRTGVAAGNISVVLCLFAAVGITGITKPKFYAGLIVATLCSLNPMGGLIMGLVAIFFAYILRWGISKLKMAFGYYSPTNPSEVAVRQ